MLSRAISPPRRASHSRSSRLFTLGCKRGRIDRDCPLPCPVVRGHNNHTTSTPPASALESLPMRASILVLLTTLFLPFTDSAPACPFCNPVDQTLTKDAAQAMLIVFGTLSNPKYDPAHPFQGTTDLNVETVVKAHDYLGDKKILTLNPYIPIEKENKGKYLVFCDVFNGKLDAYRGVLLRADSKIAAYLKGALKVKDKDVTTRLGYFFPYLDSPDIDIANDAYSEFALADYKDYRPLAEQLNPDTLTKWLKDENTPASRFGLYGSMLCHCGQAEHATVRRGMLDDQ